MRIKLENIVARFLKLLRLWPLSLAEKCRIAFGLAVIFVLTLALSWPYIWMGQLTKKAYLDTGRAKAEILLRQHFRLKEPGEMTLPPLFDTDIVLDANDPEMQFIRFTKDGETDLSQLTEQQKEMIDALRSEETREDDIYFTSKAGLRYSNYVRIFRANDKCINCHKPQGSGSAFSLNEQIGAVVIQRSADIGYTVLINWVSVIVAWLFAGAGAIVAFYMITQRVILRPIRQLRALASNVAEGNLDIRSAIKTGDEYEKLANAFNDMLDGLQAAQEKLRQANKQLDAKIAELSERNIELFKANKIKGEFLANVSHEFRTPLNAILGFAQVLRDKPGLLKKEKAQRYAENIITGGNRLLNMINDLLDLAKTEAGKMELHIEETSVPQLCKGLIASFSLLTKKKKIKVKLLTDINIPPLMTDAGKVQQILNNFLSNAVKFTPQRGRIEIRASLLPDGNTVRIAVADTGCGIAEADQEKIFEKFRQSDGSITRETTGSGLGLTISKELAAMLAGSIGLESELDKGSTFWLDIPITLVKEEARTA
ncbi:MAG: HAMP domain-containing protein [Phycisphaerae bacterium]|nr:HAMP domain-containing protein [Phycisphaerae bacterium]NIP52400.1 HAMP domain-containing protein [Phycisphaerae bacterium]NIS51396.1 HAMP domain-containing protein [Phycisphaerae bacterium]NIU09011.1 HAMP domain-containing protein [Phycisphaerae bacterium]NIU56671.1 HAMP domain-containing protein [Phycisphaerae bacterium]